MRCWYRTAETYGGDYLEVDGFSCWSKAALPAARRKKVKPTSEVQAALNRKNAERKFVRLIHANFTEDDYAVHLTYDAVHYVDDDEALKRDARNFLARLRRLYERSGVELKYVMVVAHGKRGGRGHMHLIVNGAVDRKEIKKLWHGGLCRVDELEFGEDGVAGLADYIVEQAEVYAKRWCCSRNLVRPEPVIRDDRIGPVAARELADRATSPARLWELAGKIWQGYELVSVQSQSIVDQFGGAYFTLRLIKRTSPHAFREFEHWSDAWLKRVAMQRRGEVDDRDHILVGDGRTNAKRPKGIEKLPERARREKKGQRKAKKEVR